MVCQHCGGAMTPGSGQRVRVYCGEACKTAGKWARRKARMTPASYRLQYEKSARFANAERKTFMAPECIIPECDRKPVAKDRCPRHYRHLKKAEGVAWAFQSDPASRAKMFGVAFEWFKSDDVFERDGWTCQLCDQPVDRELSYPDPMSVSLDHVVPMSKGGPHTPGNTQCSHLRCNMSKGDGGVRDHVDAVLDLTDCGMSRADIAAMVGVSVRTVSWIRKRYS